LRKALEIRPDLIVSDVMMPRLSGDQMTEALRRHREMDNVPIVLLTAKADDELQVKLLKEGVQDYIYKPFSVEELRARVAGRISERKRTEEAIHASEDRYRNALDNMLEGCQIIGFDWRYLYLNGVADKHNRRPKEELLGKKYMEMWPGIESTEVFVVIRRCMEERVPQSMENEFTFPDGSQGWFELRIYPVPEGIVIFSMDTLSAQAEEACVIAVRVTGIINSAMDAIVSIDAEQRIVFNLAAEAMFRCRQSTVIGQPPNAFSRSGSARFTQTHSAIARTGTTSRAMGIKPSMVYGATAMSSPTMPDFAFRVAATRLTVILRDVTERKRAEEALRESQQLFYKLFHSSPTAIVLSRLSDGRFVDANESFLKLTGYTLDEVIGLTSTEAGITADPQAREERLAALKQDGQLPGFEVEVIRKSGEIRNGLASVGTVSLRQQLHRHLFSISRSASWRRCCKRRMTN
jgi:PAS domain S-box-containing protein